MHFQIPILLALCAQVFQPVSATSSGGHSITKRLHNVALKHSAVLAKDLRLAMGGVFDTPKKNRKRSKSSLAKRNAYCISQKSSQQIPVSAGGGRNATTSTSTSASSATSSSTSSTSVASHKPSASSTSTSSSATASASSTSSWQLVESHSGSDFFNGWDFWDLADPTHGAVQFVDQATGQANGLVAINDAGNAIMAVETTPQVASVRQSIRITTQSTYNGGLWIMDSVHMPTGCGTWPAFWTNGPDWPLHGEIDIVEGVSNYTQDQSTIHTAPGCALSSSSTSTLGISGSVVGGTDCSAADSGNQGCGVRSSDSTSFGSGFNANGGGVYSMKWDNSGISVYFFPRQSIPSDITSGSPDPTGWGTPFANWAATDCSPFEFFTDHSTIFDTTLCGDWAGSVWDSSGIPGQEQSCAQRTGYSTCEAFVQAEGASFAEAYWEVSSMKIYQQPS